MVCAADFVRADAAALGALLLQLVILCHHVCVRIGYKTDTQ
jgi:hypothetical protein